MGSISHPPGTLMFNDTRPSGGKVGISEVSGDIKQQTSEFANGEGLKQSTSLV